MKKSSGKIVYCGQVYEESPLRVKNFGIWLHYDSCSGTHNMDREFHDLTTAGTVVTARIGAVKMGKFMKPGKVVLVLARRYSGSKAIITKNISEGTSNHPYRHTLVARIDHFPKK
ncbi:60S ribosomal protein L18a [Fukomys damarensis]|uniref:60S ribosomal protein L18a n=1 Tax=Fukomys damarensis TaxID=885580 RepID=A0A091D7I7_FUKDA|nr:60S ribosomal protein L18a [Fukomys damarensis]